MFEVKSIDQFLLPEFYTKVYQEINTAETTVRCDNTLTQI